MTTGPGDGLRPGAQQRGDRDPVALGAQRHNAEGMVLRQALVLAVAGVVIGTAAAMETT